jgi:NAD(P) transhydrogenase subunit alpha
MKLAVPRETRPGERRVALVPDAVKKVVSSGAEVAVQQGAGAEAYFSDADYRESGALITADLASTVEGAGAIAKVQPPTSDEVAALPAGATLISLLQPASHLEVVKALADRGVDTFSLDLLPRISRAQSMDALSSQATVQGYKAAIMAADMLPRFFPMFMTAAGTIPPAKVLVLGAGVAGLQAIATARRLGAVVKAYDVRTASRQEVESLGATFIELDLEAQEGSGGYAGAQTEEFLAAQRDLIGSHVAVSDVVITTAAIPGRRAPMLVTTQMVESMPNGSVIIDIAAESGGNCELSQAGKDVVHGHVTIRGAQDLASSMPTHASSLYARNISAYFATMLRDGELAPDFDDEIISATCVVRSGQVVHSATRELLKENEA